MLTLLIIILHDISCLPDLLEAWKKIGVPGVTIMESVGGFQAENLIKRSGLSALLNLFDQSTEKQRFIFSLINNQDTLDQAISEADRVVGGFDRPSSGILFTLPVGQVLGLQKRRVIAADEDLKLPDKDSDNLLSWFEEEVKNQYGEKVVSNWDSKRKQQISQIVFNSKLSANIIPVDSTLDEVLAAFKENPEVPIACVINSEDRLVGLIDAAQLMEMKLIPTMPQKFIQNPEGYEKALAYAKKYPEYLASDIMKEPVYVLNEGNIEEAFFAFHNSKLTCLPVVNKHYRIKGIISLLDLVNLE